MRHGATLWNAGGRFQGISDVALSELGIAQAGAISRRLAAVPIDRIYTSDRSRALETARVIALPHGMTPLSDVRLREFDFGAWEGLTWDEIVRRTPALRDCDATAARDYAPPGGETFGAVRARVRPFLDEVLAGGVPDAADDASPHVVVVTHAGVLHAVLAELNVPAPPGLDRFSPGGITKIAVRDGAAALHAFDDLQHLQ